jgi:hypothetical protein
MSSVLNLQLKLFPTNQAAHNETSISSTFIFAVKTQRSSTDLAGNLLGLEEAIRRSLLFDDQVFEIA